MPMTGPRRYLVRMIIFLLAVAAAVVLLFPRLQTAFLANPGLNGMILGVLAFGIAFVFRQVLMIGPEVSWLESYRRGGGNLSVKPPKLLAPMAAMLGERKGKLSLSASATRSILDGISARLDESQEISRYLIGLLVFLGLLGTFWGLLQTVSAVGSTIANLSIGTGDATALFGELKKGLETPLSGMGTAFSSSLLGLSGSLVVGFLELQAGQANNRFFNDLEEWLSGLTRLGSGGPVGDGDQPLPAYIQALLEQTADNLETLQRTLSRSEENRTQASSNMIQLTERLTTLSDQMRSNQTLMLKFAEAQMELRPALTRFVDLASEGGFDEATRNHIRNIEVYMARLVDDVSTGRNQAVQELRSEIKLLARTIAALAEESDRP
jgi:hypothetical protein